MIRRALSRDLDNLKELFQEVIAVNYSPFLDQEVVEDYIESGASDAEIEEHLPHMIVYQRAGKILGYCVYFDDIINALVVRSGYQNKGFGKKLIQHAEQQIFRKHNKIRLETFADNGVAICFFERLGFEETGLREDDGGYIMAKMVKQKAGNWLNGV